MYAFISHSPCLSHQTYCFSIALHSNQKLIVLVCIGYYKQINDSLLHCYLLQTNM